MATSGIALPTPIGYYSHPVRVAAPCPSNETAGVVPAKAARCSERQRFGMLVIRAVTVIPAQQSEEMLTNADVRTVTAGCRRGHPGQAHGGARQLRWERRPARGAVRDRGGTLSQWGRTSVTGVPRGKQCSRESSSSLVTPVAGIGCPWPFGCLRADSARHTVRHGPPATRSPRSEPGGAPCKRDEPVAAARRLEKPPQRQRCQRYPLAMSASLSRSATRL